MGYLILKFRDSIKPRSDDLGLIKYGMRLSALLVMLRVIPVDLLHTLQIHYLLVNASRVEGGVEGAEVESNSNSSPDLDSDPSLEEVI